MAFSMFCDLLKNYQREFPDGLVVMIQYHHCCSLGSIPGLGTEIPYRAAASHSQRKESGRIEIFLKTTKLKKNIRVFVKLVKLPNFFLPKCLAFNNATSNSVM